MFEEGGNNDYQQQMQYKQRPLPEAELTKLGVEVTFRTGVNTTKGKKRSVKKFIIKD